MPSSQSKPYQQAQVSAKWMNAKPQYTVKPVKAKPIAYSTTLLQSNLKGSVKYAFAHIYNRDLILNLFY